MITDKFRANEINVLELHTEINLQVALEEINFSIDRILNDINEGFGDKQWEFGANHALKELEHKGKLVRMKLDACKRKHEQEELEKENKKNRYSDNALMAFKFRDSAKAILDLPTFEKIKSLARLNTGEF